MSTLFLGKFLFSGEKMNNPVEYVREFCKKRHIPIAVLEKECGFANGYLNPKKLMKIPYDRAVIIANYLGIDVKFLLPNMTDPPSPDEILKSDIERAKIALFGGDGEVTDEMWEEAVLSAEVIKERHRRMKEKK